MAITECTSINIILLFVPFCYSIYYLKKDIVAYNPRFFSWFFPPIFNEKLSSFCDYTRLKISHLYLLKNKYLAPIVSYILALGLLTKLLKLRISYGIFKEDMELYVKLDDSTLNTTLDVILRNPRKKKKYKLESCT